MAETIQDIKKQNELLLKKLDYYEKDAAFGGFFTLNRIVNQQREYLNKFSIAGYIASEDKVEQLAYKNAKDLWENLPDMITQLNRLRIDLKLDGNENEEKIIPMSPENMGDF
jgi:hypothetical protein